MTKPFQLLTIREQEVVHLLANGLTYAEIAIALQVKHETIKMHLKHIYRKLNVSNKVQALKKLKRL
jgi:DNA-binding CsgD family transcriptional regulator